MIGDPDDFELEDPNKHTERQVDFHNLLRQRYRSLFSVPSNRNGEIVKKEVYQLYVHI